MMLVVLHLLEIFNGRECKSRAGTQDSKGWGSSCNTAKGVEAETPVP